MTERTGSRLFTFRDVFVVVLLLGIGAIFGLWRMQNADLEMRHDLVRRARLLAEAINPVYVGMLSGTEEDLSSPAYLRFKRQFRAALKAFPDYRFITLVGRRPDGTIFFYVDSEQDGSPDGSPPGEVYDVAETSLLDAFNEGRSVVAGPFEDVWGSLVTAWVPVSNPGAPPFVLALDVDGEHWHAQTRRAAVVPAVTSFALALLFLAGRFLFARRAALNDTERRRGRYRYLEVVFVAAAGCVLSFSAVLIASDAERRAQEHTFRLLADAESEEIHNSLKNLRDVGIEGLGSFYEHSTFVDYDEFIGFTRHLERLPEVLGATWIPYVPGEERESFESFARTLVNPDFFIWDVDPSGEVVPAPERPFYFPVLYRVPLKGSERVIGRDFGSSPPRRGAIEEAARSRLVTATDPISLVTGGGALRGMAVFRPVFSRGGTGEFLGAVTLVIELNDLLTRSLSYEAHLGGDLLFASLWFLDESIPPSRILSLEGEVPENEALSADDAFPFVSTSFFAIRPIFAFGKALAVVLRPGSGFFSLHPARAGKMTALVGTLVTAVLALLALFSANRRDDLERLVSERTDELSKSRSELLSMNVSLLETTRRAQELARRAEAANDAKGRFLANMSHEMRTPMNGFLGMTRLLLDTPMTGEQREYALSAQRCGEALLSMISDALDMTSIDAGDFRILREDFDLAALLRNIETLYGTAAKEKGLFFTLDLHAGVPPRLYGDGRRLHRILRNLVDNAVKFTERGSISLSVFPLEERSKELWLRFRVRDTGIGISEDDREHIFERFWQRDDSSTKHHQGSGMGLPVAKELTGLLGGRLDFGSAEGGGTVFLLDLPFEKPLSGGEDAPSPANETERKTILVVEDNYVNRKVVTLMLGKMGYSVRTAENGREALDFLSSNDCDLVLMDVQMPVMDGVEATRAIRGGAVPDPAIPVVALTAYTSPSDRERCLSAGMNDFLAKPASPEQLEEVLRRLLSAGGVRTDKAVSAVSPSLFPDSFPVFDREGALKRLMGDEEALVELAAEFLEDLPSEIAMLSEAIRRGESSEAGNRAHALKGAAAGMGGERLRSVAFELEKAGRANDIDTLRNLLPKAEEQFELLQEALRAFIAESGTGDVR